MSNRWKEIWENRNLNDNIISSNNIKDIFLESKRCNGFDVVNEGLTYEALFEQYKYIKRNLFDNCDNTPSVFEVGCGSGANLFLFENEGFECGGIDYSSSQIESAKKILKSHELYCDEAKNLNTNKKYTAVLSNSVFSYFQDENYARSVLDKMLEKSTYSIGIIDIHDKEKEKEFIEYRRKTVKNYDEKYKDCKKLFYTKDFFIKYAKENNLKIVFKESQMENYWNNNFIFDCYMYKK